MKLLIAIVNYRTANLVVDCLRSISRQRDEVPGLQVVVVDNASGDDSVERLKAATEANDWAGWVHVLPSGRNGGFAFGNNVALRFAIQEGLVADCVLLLNPDTTVAPGALASLLGFIQANHSVGIAGGCLEDAAGQAQRSAHCFPSPVRELTAWTKGGPLSYFVQRCSAPRLAHDVPAECDWVSGAAMLVRWQVLEQVGLLDERYFLYFEEVDLCWRARRAGWHVWHLPTARITHLEGAATGIGDAIKPRPSYWFASRRRFFLKWYGSPGLILADLFSLAGHTIGCLRAVFGRDLARVRWLLRFMQDLVCGDLQAAASGGRIRD